MTEREAAEKLRAYHKCQRLQVKGIYEDCNEKLCDNCDLCYMQGTAGEHIKSIEMAIQALEKQIPKKLESWGACQCCPSCKVVHIYFDNYCSNCGQKILWWEAENNGK